MIYPSPQEDDYRREEEIDEMLLALRAKIERHQAIVDGLQKEHRKWCSVDHFWFK